MQSLTDWYDSAKLDRRRGVFQRIWSNLDLSDIHGCWLWRGYRKPFYKQKGAGYGSIMVAGESRAVTRVLWETVVGPIPEGMHVLHSCDNPGCCKLGHLFLGTHAENMADKKRKGRVRFGPRHGEYNSQAKLTAAEVQAIREATGLQREIALRFGITQSHVSSIRRGDKRKID